MNETGKYLRMLGRIFAIIGGVMFLIGAVMMLIYLMLTASVDSGILIGGGIIAGYGCIFLLAALVLGLVARRQRARVERLKRDGERYDAHITRVYENPYYRVNYVRPLIVECGYKDKLGKTYLVKSRNIWVNPLLVKEDRLQARVYVSAVNPRDYYVEVSDTAYKDAEGQTYDYDYR